MENDILVITPAQVKSLRTKLKDTGQTDSAIRELRRMIEIKSTLCWRAEARASCCGPGISFSLDAERQTLDEALQELQSGNIGKAATLLEAYEKMIPQVPLEESS
ncbi:MAG: hypothetical protein R6U37_08930 [Dehalococcoidia bacterium]